MLREPATGQPVIVRGGGLQHGARQRQRLVRQRPRSGQCIVARRRILANEYAATGNVGRGDGRGARRHDGNRRARQDLAVGQSGRAADRAAAKALDADGEEVARQVALDQHRAAAAHEFPETDTAKHRRRADLNEMRNVQIRFDR